MISNATLQRIDTPQTANPLGDVLYTPGAPLTVRACQDEPSDSQKYVLGIIVADATAVLYVLMSAIATGLLVPRNHLVVQMDGFGAKTYQILGVRNFVKSGGLSNFEVWLKGL